VQSAYVRARNILTSNESELHALAGELLEKETLSGEQISGIMKQVGPGPSRPGQQRHDCQYLTIKAIWQCRLLSRQQWPQCQLAINFQATRGSAVPSLGNSGNSVGMPSACRATVLSPVTHFILTPNTAAAAVAAVADAGGCGAVDTPPVL
jgi:hypothetical protein